MIDKEIAVQLTCAAIQGSGLSLSEDSAAQVVNFFKLVCAELEKGKKKMSDSELRITMDTLNKM